MFYLYYWIDFGVKDIVHFFDLFHFDLLILTKGKKGATYLFRENNEIKIIDKKPKVIVDIVDSSGAGDAFFSVNVQKYAYTNKIDANFVDNVFELANQFSREVISNMGSRIKK